MKEQRPADFILRFCTDIVGLQSLHFGLWDSSFPRTIEGLKKAQEAYSLLLLDRIPQGARTVLDAGCGTGELSERLIERGYVVTALTPDPYLADIVKKRLGAKVTFALSKFEEFQAPAPFDVIIMSESCQYMSHHLTFPKARELLNPGGHLLISDYFRKTETDYYETVWTDKDFWFRTKQCDFELVSLDDITDRTLPTLDVASATYSKTILPTIELVRDLFAHVCPKIVLRFLKFVLRKPLRLASQFLYVKQPAQFDAERFKEHLEYRVLLLRQAVPAATALAGDRQAAPSQSVTPQ
jgi:SAM-dependent methyltransferase